MYCYVHPPSCWSLVVTAHSGNRLPPTHFVALRINDDQRDLQDVVPICSDADFSNAGWTECSYINPPTLGIQ